MLPHSSQNLHFLGEHSEALPYGETGFRHPPSTTHQGTYRVACRIPSPGCRWAGSAGRRRGVEQETNGFRIFTPQSGDIYITMQQYTVLFVRVTSLKSPAPLHALILTNSSKDMNSLILFHIKQFEECHAIFCVVYKVRPLIL